MYLCSSMPRSDSESVRDSLTLDFVTVFAVTSPSFVGPTSEKEKVQ